VIVNFLFDHPPRTEPIPVRVHLVCGGRGRAHRLHLLLGNVIWKPDSGALTGIPECHPAVVLRPQRLRAAALAMALGVAYYVLPIATRSPLYSHTLSLLGFWSLIIVYTHIGTHHLLQVPVPTWLKTISIVDSVAMVIPVMVFLINIWYTVKGKLGDVHADIGAKVRLHRHHLLLLRQHPGLDDGLAGRPAHHAFQQTGWWPTPTSACWGSPG